MEQQTIIMYRFTGRQGFFTIPKKWCEECDLLKALVEGVLKEHGLENKVTFIVRPWWLWWPVPLLRYGSWHAPQLIINGKLLSQGIVPDKKDIERALGVGI